MGMEALGVLIFKRTLQEKCEKLHLPYVYY